MCMVKIGWLAMACMLLVGCVGSKKAVVAKSGVTQIDLLQQETLDRLMDRNRGVAPRMNADYALNGDDESCESNGDCRRFVKSGQDDQDVVSFSEVHNKHLLETEVNGGNGGQHQYAIYPNEDLDLVQLPDESDFQYVNVIYTSTVDSPADLVQQAEFRNVRFNQLRSPDALHTINATITNDKSVSGRLEQGFKFKRVEMIQSDSAGSTHAMNYLGDR